jgi:hypothetical protein
MVEPTHPVSNPRFETSIVFTTNYSFSIRRYFHRQRDALGDDDFVILKTSWSSLSNMLICVWCVCVCSYSFMYEYHHLYCVLKNLVQNKLKMSIFYGENMYFL